MASEKWAGFTDEDIKQINTSSAIPNRNKCGLKQTSSSDRLHSCPLKLKEVTSESLENILLCETSEFKNTDKCQQLQENCSKKNISNCKVVPPIINGNCSENEGVIRDDNKGDLLSDYYDSSCTMSENEHQLCVMDSELEAFEARQKRIEAENARRRALINKAITDKKMQTQAEATKLAKITQELKHLDSILSSDVSILRDYIEQASIDFSEAEKQYLKAEKEFIEAKFHLYEKMQRKEQLTEHLCAIIEQTENRKANKLVELMRQLEMEAIVENLDTEDSQPILSKFRVLNDETYHCCTTLKPPSHPPSYSSLCENKTNKTIDHKEVQPFNTDIQETTSDLET